VLNWCASNLVARRDANMNTAPDKKKAPDKIDDMVALLMAVGMATAADGGEASITQGFVEL
jgi:phage terminase large subunit-like protein